VDSNRLKEIVAAVKPGALTRAAKSFIRSAWRLRVVSLEANSTSSLLHRRPRPRGRADSRRSSLFALAFMNFAAPA